MMGVYYMTTMQDPLAPVPGKAVAGAVRTPPPTETPSLSACASAAPMGHDGRSKRGGPRPVGLPGHIPVRTILFSPLVWLASAVEEWTTSESLEVISEGVGVRSTACAKDGTATDPIDNAPGDMHGTDGTDPLPVIDSAEDAREVPVSVVGTPSMPDCAASCMGAVGVWTTPSLLDRNASAS